MLRSDISRHIWWRVAGRFTASQEMMNLCDKYVRLHKFIQPKIVKPINRVPDTFYANTVTVILWCLESFFAIKLKKEGERERNKRFVKVVLENREIVHEYGEKIRFRGIFYSWIEISQRSE